MSTYHPFEIAKPGKAVATNGQAVDFTPEILADLAESYDPSLFEAPIVVGHPTLNAPAFGSIGQVRYDAARQRLDAQPSHVDPSFAEAVNRRLYRTVSMSVYLPDSPSNPKPGSHYLRHVGFLGAHPPAIKGLRAVQFADQEQGVVMFGEWDDVTNAGLWRKLRDWFIGQFGQDTADKVLPGADIDFLQQSAVQESMEDAMPAASYSEPRNPSEATMATQTTDKTAEFAEREAALKTQEQQLIEQKAALDRKAAELKRRETADFAEGLIKEGKVLPRDKAGLIEFMAALPEGATLEFGEGDDRKTLPSRQWFEGFLKGLPKQVDFGEFDKGGETGQVVDNSDKAIADRATAYKNRLAQQGVHISFAEAVDGVRANEDR